MMTSGKAMICIQVLTGGCSEAMAGGRTGEQERVTEEVTGACAEALNR